MRKPLLSRRYHTFCPQGFSAIGSNSTAHMLFAVSKSGTISLEISKKKIPSIIIYKMNFINFLIVKMLVKIKYANIKYVI